MPSLYLLPTPSVGVDRVSCGNGQEKAVLLWWRKVLFFCSKLDLFCFGTLTNQLQAISIGDAFVFDHCYYFSLLKEKHSNGAGILINADTKPSVGLTKSGRSEKCIKEIKFHEGSLEGTISGKQNPYQMATKPSKYKGVLTPRWSDQRLQVRHCVINLLHSLHWEIKRQCIRNAIITKL